MLNGIVKRPYQQNSKESVKKKQDEEKTSSAGKEEQNNPDSKSKGLQYAEESKPTYSPDYLNSQKNSDSQFDWRQMRSQIQSQMYTQRSVPRASSKVVTKTPVRDLPNNSSSTNGTTTRANNIVGNTAVSGNVSANTNVGVSRTNATSLSSVSSASVSPMSQTASSAVNSATSSTVQKRSSEINIAQILKDFNNTAIAIGTPDALKEEVGGYVALIEAQVNKDEPNVSIIKSNLKNASSLLDGYISQTLNKESKVVENWVDALFLQKVDFKYNEEDVNKQFLVKFPEGTIQQEEKAEAKLTVDDTIVEPIEQEIQSDNKITSLIPQDKELKSLFIQSKKLAYANEPKRAIATFEQALIRAEEVEDIETQSKIFYEVGRIYDDNNHLPQALKSYNESLQNTSDNNLKTKAHYSMAQIYDEANQITPALDHYFSSISYAGEAENLTAQSASLTKMGNIYTDMYDQQAMDYYSIAEDLSAQTDNSKVKGFVAESQGNAYEVFGEPQEALRAYSGAVKNYVEAESPLKVAQNYSKASDLMKEYGNDAKAKGLLEKALGFARQTDDVNFMNEINEKLVQYA
ncbi:MAG: hypothetical protein R3Y28_08645 [Candidatus Gastranaerophilales bacterium]